MTDGNGTKAIRFEPPEPSLTPDAMIARAVEMRSVLRGRQHECEQLGRLPDQTNAEFVQAGFYRIVQPRCFGGYEFDLQTFIRVMTEVARGCVDSAWTLALTAGHTLALLGGFPEQGQREAYGQSGECRAPGVALPGGVAIPVEGGYHVKGAWDYCSGADIGTHFLGALMALQPGSNVPRAYMYVLIDRKDYQIVDNWNVFGMQGTGSRRVVVNELFVPSHRTMELANVEATGIRHHRNQPGRNLHPNPLFHGPIVPFLLFELVSVVLGGALGALDVYEQMLRDKKLKFPPFSPHFETPEAQRRYGDAQGLIDTAEAAVFGVAAKYTELCRREQMDGIMCSEEDARRLQRAQQQCVDLCWQAVELMFRTAGTSSATTSSMMGRYFRNLAVIRTHVTIQSDHTSTNAGRARFGLPPFSAL